MLLRTHKIPVEGLDLSFAIKDSDLRAGLEKGDEARARFDHPADCNVHVEKMKDDLYLSGKVQTQIHPSCDRCGEDFDRNLDIDLFLTCSPEEKKVKGADYHQESDEGLIFYTHDELNFVDIVREQLLLALPMKNLCKEDCLGLCPSCGINLNLETRHSCAKVSKKN